MPEMIIRVPENENKSILDREKVVSDIKTHLGPWTALIHDVASYGSNLIPRCFVSSERSIGDSVIIAILLRQVVAMIDAVDVLLACGATHAAHLPVVRALFEASVYIEWILQGDSEKKARYYYVHNIRRKRFWSTRTQSGSVESTTFLAMMSKLGVDMGDAIKGATQQLKEIDKVLSQAGFAEISKHFDTMQKRKGHDVLGTFRSGREMLPPLQRLSIKKRTTRSCTHWDLK